MFSALVVASGSMLDSTEVIEPEPLVFQEVDEATADDGTQNQMNFVVAVRYLIFCTDDATAGETNVDAALDHQKSRNEEGYRITSVVACTKILCLDVTHALMSLLRSFSQVGDINTALADLVLASDRKMYD